MDYVFYTVVSLGCSFLLYFFILKNQKTFQFNRFFFLVSVSLCLLAPVLEINTFEAVPSLTEISFKPSVENSISEALVNIGTIVETETSNFTLFSMLWYLYLFISIGFLLRFIKNLYDIIKLTKQNHSSIGDLKLVETNDHKNGSSFFNYLFINSESLNEEDYSKSVIQHELVHCNEKHTVDVIFIELLLCFFWFNPFMWLYKKAMVQNHEFIADSQTVQSGIDRETYSQTIIKSGHKEYRVPLTSGFNFIQIKNRIIMLHQSKSSLLKRTVKITSVILLFGCIFVFSCTYKDINNDPLIVVIDVAHGGKDSGNSIEKDVVLDISNVLASLSDEKIQIIQTRSHDEFLTLRERTDFINTTKPDLFLSLHCNASQNKLVSGVEAYYDSESTHNETTLTYAEILVEHQLDHFSNRGVKTAKIFLLNNTKVPGISLELGFLTNENDRKVLTDKEQQVKIAKSIYEGLLEIRDL
ncbi:MAG: N-acetylmuramoyl-L-alanine amidase [Dokdonia sp.]|jgi:N-acetylmuramoyl-L-alanine amidase